MRRQVVEKGGLAHSIIVATADVHRTVASIAESVRSDLHPIHCWALGVTAAYRPEKGCLADRVVEVIAPMPLAFAAALACPHRLVATTGDVIAGLVGGTRDPVLMLMMQQHDEVWGAANAELRVEECHCGEVHTRAVATQAIPAGAQVRCGLWHSGDSAWLLQFDGSGQRDGLAGGAGWVLCQVGADNMAVDWGAVPIAPCSDNLVAEAIGLDAGLWAALAHIASAEGLGTGQLVVQGDVLPHLQFMRYEGRSKRSDIVQVLSHLRTFVSHRIRAIRYLHLPRKANKIADRLAGIARGVFCHRTPCAPYFTLELGWSHP